MCAIIQTRQLWKHCAKEAPELTQALLSCMQTCVAKSPECSAVTEFCMNFKTFHLVLFPSVWRVRRTLQHPRAVEKKDALLFWELRQVVKWSSSTIPADQLISVPMTQLIPFYPSNWQISCTPPDVSSFRVSVLCLMCVLYLFYSYN